MNINKLVKYHQTTKITIILTSTVNVNLNKIGIFQKDPTDRISTYLTSILQWINNTTFNIILVENSGYEFKELEAYKSDRIEIISFNENELLESNYLINNRSKGASEIFAINYAYTHSNIIKDSIFIIKITARFYIHNLKHYLKQFDLNKYDCLTQHNRNRCEMVGSNINNFKDIFNINLLNKHNKYNGYIENIWKYRTTRYKNILICKQFKIDKTPRGGVDMFYTNI